MPLPKTPLQHNIDEFEKAAKQYHKLKHSTSRTKKERDDLDKELKTRLADLKARKLQLKTKACVQERTDLQVALASYQKSNSVQGNNSAVTEEQYEWMDNEAHHPTKVLRENMAANGDLAPDKNCACHHIVEGKGRTIPDPDAPKGPRIQTQNAIMARVHLHMYGVGINDPDNGVYLPKYMKHTPHWRFPKALPHANIHTFKYEEWVYNTLEPNESEQSVRSALHKLRIMLEHGSEIGFLTTKTQTAYQLKMETLGLNITA